MGTGQVAEAGVLEGQVRFISDETTNAVIVTTYQRAWEEIQETIRQLDRMPRQVLIEVLVTEVRLTDNLQLGMDWAIRTGNFRLFSSSIPGTIGTPVTPPFPTPSVPLILPAGGLTALAFSANEFLAMITALAADNRVNVISNPHILTSENKKAVINVSTSIPIITSQQIPFGAGTTTGGTNQAAIVGTQSVEYRDTGVVLTVTPRIGERGTVALDVKQEVNDIGEQTPPTNSFSIIKREAETSVVLVNNQTLVLGGLIRDRRATVNSGIPVLKDIPLLGYVFGFKSQIMEKTELLILITPRVVGTALDAAKVTDEYRRVSPSLDEAIKKAPRQPNIPLPPAAPLAPAPGPTPGPPPPRSRDRAPARLGTLIGMVHLAPLPGSPRWRGSMAEVIDGALADARALVEGGLDALLVENFGDAPFAPGRAEASTVAALSVVAGAIRAAWPAMPLGINVLRNDARSALAVACATGAVFVRANVHAGAVVADQGSLQSDAYATLRERRLLGADVAIFADVQTKHAGAARPRRDRAGGPRSRAPRPRRRPHRDRAVDRRAHRTGRRQARAGRRPGGAAPRRQRRQRGVGGRAAVGRRRGHRGNLAQARRARRQPGRPGSRAPPRGCRAPLRAREGIAPRRPARRRAARHRVPGRLLRGPRAAAPPDLGALLLVGFSGTEVFGNRELEELLCVARVGGIILFARNIVDAEQVARLTRDARDASRACTGRSLLVATDAEGGQVMRLGPNAGYTPTLSHQDLGEGNDLAVTELEARRIGRMLSEAGIDWNLAPVVDVGYNPANPVIVRPRAKLRRGPASWSPIHARAYIRGMHAEGVLTTLKHFPGHGSSFADSHLGFVDVTDTANRDVELLPYRTLIAEGLADSVMTGHVFNRRLDARYPATLSRSTIHGVLRKDLRFTGVVVSDDLRMGAIEKHWGLADASVIALRADVDMLLIADDRLPDGRSAAQIALDALRDALAKRRLEAKQVLTALRRVDALRARAATLRR